MKNFKRLCKEGGPLKSFVFGSIVGSVIFFAIGLSLGFNITSASFRDQGIEMISVILNPTFLGAGFGAFVAVTGSLIIYYKQKKDEEDKTFVESNIEFLFKFYDIYERKEELISGLNNSITKYERVIVRNAGESGEVLSSSQINLSPPLKQTLREIRGEVRFEKNVDIPLEIFRSYRRLRDHTFQINAFHDDARNSGATLAQIESYIIFLNKFKKDMESILYFYERIEKLRIKYK